MERVRTLTDLMREQSQRPVNVNGLFKRQDDRIKELEAQVATMRRVIHFQNDIINAGKSNNDSLLQRDRSGCGELVMAFDRGRADRARNCGHKEY